MRPADELAAAVVRAWTRAYTVRLNPSVGEARRAEIDSDLWEHSQAARETATDPRPLAGQILARCLLGVVADLTWRSQMAAGPGRLVKEEVPMNERIRRNWWIPAPIALIGLGGLFVLAHVVGDGYESPWSHTASGWNPSLPARAGAVALWGSLFVVLPIWALAVRRVHPGWSVGMLSPLVLVSVMAPWGLASVMTPWALTWPPDGPMLALPMAFGIVTIVGAIVNLAQRSLEQGSVPSPAPAPARPEHG